MAALSLKVGMEIWPFERPFHITGYTIENAKVVTVRLSDGERDGWGEAGGVFYLGETCTSMISQIEQVRVQVEAGIDRDGLLALLPAGGARNALDAALWALESQQQRRAVWRLAGLDRTVPLLTTVTLGVDTPEAMAEAAGRLTIARAIKIKLDGSADDLPRVRGIRHARPDVQLLVDANQGWSISLFEAIVPSLAALDVKVIEQPFRVGEDAYLYNYDSPVPIAADESFQDEVDLADMASKYDIVNIKLDKCGGLTRGLALAKKAREAGLGVMVGCMPGTSLSMAPAFLLGQHCDIVDLDGPLILRTDRLPSARYANGKIDCSEHIWGYAE